MKKKTLFLYLIFLFSTSSFAMTERTQYFWQPLKGFSALNLSAEDSVNSYTTSAPGVSNTVSQITPTYTLAYSYGLSSQWAAGLLLSFSPSLSQTSAIDGTVTETSTNGPNNVMLTFKNTTPLSKWNLHYGLTLSLSLDVNQPAQLNSQGNNFTGGDGATPYIGTSYNIFGKSFLGLKAQYDYLQTRTIDPNRAVTGARQRSGGNSATGSAYFEWHRFPWLTDVSGGGTWVDSSQTIQTLTEISTAPYTSIFENLGLQFFFSQRLMARLQGTLTQVSQITASNGIQSSHTIFTGTAMVRDEF